MGVAWGGLLWALGCNLAQPKWATLGAHTRPSPPKPSVVKIQTKSTSPTKSGRASSRKAQPWGAKHPKNLTKWAPKGLKWPKCVPKRRFFLECRGCAPERRVVKQAVVNPCPNPGRSSNYIFTTLGAGPEASVAVTHVSFRKLPM